ncbi:hypothetical protein [Sorangium sp. So ce1000]|uniref:hypothetical protein n=1 Tax=Sorangium sp. So ce1000 TaxID=3133325 RepID=UPI003F5E34B0
MSASSPAPVSTPGTIVCPHLDVPHQPGMNLVWSASLELAWKRLMKQAGGPIELAGVAPDDPAARLVKILNESPIEEGMLPPEATVAWAGRADERGTRELRGEVERVFGPEEARRIGMPDAERVSVLGGIDLHPRFAVPFARRDRAISCDDKYALGFGLWRDDEEPFAVWEKRAAQVVVHFPRYTDEQLADLSDEEEDAAWNQLVIELRPLNSAFSLVVAATGRRETLRGTVEQCLSRLQDDDHAPNGRFTEKEGVCLPIVDIHCDAVFRELSSRRIANAGLRGCHLGELRQWIDFRLDEGGSSAVSSMRNPYGGALMSPRRWYYSASLNFVAVINRKMRMPFWASWFGNASAFVEGTEPEDSLRLRRFRGNQCS